MSSLSQLLAFFERVPSDELHLTSGESPYVVSGGQRRPVGSQPVNARLILAAASELLSQDELEHLPEERPRVVRHEHEGSTWLVELLRRGSGLSLTIRRAKSLTRVERRPEFDTAVLGPMRVQTPHDGMRTGKADPKPAYETGKTPAAPTMACKPTRTSSSDSFLHTLLHDMVTTGASDLHVSAGHRATLRVHGEMRRSTNESLLSNDEVEALIRPIMPKHAIADFDERRNADFSYDLEGVARFRVNVSEDRTGMGVAIRQIAIDVPTVEDLALPKGCVDLCQLTTGLVVVTGPKGSGKSTTLAAMLDQVNRTRNDHIVTLEDPVEFLHVDRKCIVHQREIGPHAKSFRSGLASAVHSDADIVFVGELRDLDTAAMALEAAESGHLVFATMRTLTAVSAIERIIDYFPGDKQHQARVMVSRAMKGVVAQTLCKKVSGGRIAAHEVLLSTPAVAALIREGKTFQMPGIMQVSKALGMMTLNESLTSLVQRQLVTPLEAASRAVDKLGLGEMLSHLSRHSSTYRLRTAANDIGARPTDIGPMQDGMLERIAR